MSLPRLLAGPLPRLPAPVDHAARVWAGLPGRVRLLARVVGLAAVLVAAAGGLARGPWGPPVPVLVTTRDVAAGTPVLPQATTIASRPAELVPTAALTSVASLPPDALAAVRLPAGTVVTTGLVVAGGPGGLATDGSAVVAVDATLLPPLTIGSRLDLAVPGLDGTTRIAARDVVVVADDGTWRWLRVARDDVEAVAAGISDGRLVAAVLPPTRRAASP